MSRNGSSPGPKLSAGTNFHSVKASFDPVGTPESFIQWTYVLWNFPSCHEMFTQSISMGIFLRVTWANPRTWNGRSQDGEDTGDSREAREDPMVSTVPKA